MPGMQIEGDLIIHPAKEEKRENMAHAKNLIFYKKRLYAEIEPCRATQASGAGLTRRRSSHRDCGCDGSSILVLAYIGSTS
jgi:hypothetical protein